MAKAKDMIGWKEWSALPALQLPAVKAKVDTGAKTSALHAYDIKPFTKDGQRYVRFKIHPLQKNKKLEVVCEAPLSDYRSVTSSNGEREKRYVIMTPVCIGTKTVAAELTLTARHKMTFRMLIGRDAIVKGKFVVDPVKSFIQGKIRKPEDLYTKETGE